MIDTVILRSAHRRGGESELSCDGCGQTVVVDRASEADRTRVQTVVLDFLRQHWGCLHPDAVPEQRSR